MAVEGTKRSTCWSITINNPTQADIDNTNNVSGWKDFIEFQGQIEKGENGTEHIQGMLRTKSVKFSVVKKHFPRAHIEVARSPAALTQYVHKEDTKLAEIPTTRCATVSDLNRIIYDIFTYHSDKEIRDTQNVDTIIGIYNQKYKDQAGLVLLDQCVEQLIDTDYYGVEYIGANPSIRTTWKKYWSSIVRREYRRVSEELRPKEISIEEVE